LFNPSSERWEFRKNVIHRDLKPGNILIENLDEGKIKICDFGLAKLGEKKGIDDGTFGTPQYAAPELGFPGATAKVDVYSFSMM
jgi:serine/threonine protein kinase